MRISTFQLVLITILFLTLFSIKFKNIPSHLESIHQFFKQKKGNSSNNKKTFN